MIISYSKGYNTYRQLNEIRKSMHDVKEKFNKEIEIMKTIKQKY